MKYVPFIGAGSALVTPMTRDDKVNYAEFAKMVDDQIKEIEELEEELESAAAASAAGVSASGVTSLSMFVTIP